jgi:hypothetical protein
MIQPGAFRRWRLTCSFHSGGRTNCGPLNTVNGTKDPGSFLVRRGDIVEAMYSVRAQVYIFSAPGGP